MKINVKKGFFRLWMVASIVWIAAAGSLLFPAANNKVSTLSDSLMFDRAYKMAAQLYAGDLSGRKKEIYEEGLRRDIIPNITFGIDLLDEDLMSKPREEQLTEAGIFVDYLGKKKQFPAGSKPNEIWNAYKPDIRSKRLKIYSEAVGWIFIPPLVALSIALIIAWVFRGFVALDKNT